MATKTRLPTEQLSEQSRELYDVLNDKSDLAAILISTSFVDACLKSILENKLLDGSTTERLLNHTGILGSMRARADLCYAMGLIPKSWYTDLITLGEIRNQVAHHHLTQTFQSPEIAIPCGKLSMPLEGTFIDSNLDTRSHYKISVVMLANWLLITALQIKRTVKPATPKDPRHILASAKAP